MKIDEIKKEGERNMHAFSIENLLLGREGAVEAVSKIPGVEILEVPKRFYWFNQDIFCKFKVNGVLFEIEEPYGDNSMYWVGKSPDGGACPELEVVANTFREFSPVRRLQRKAYSAIELVIYGIGALFVGAIIWAVVSGRPIAI